MWVTFPRPFNWIIFEYLYRFLFIFFECGNICHFSLAENIFYETKILEKSSSVIPVREGEA